MLKEILAVSGKSGLYKLVSKGNNLLIIESLVDKKRIPAYARDKVISIGDISIYTDEDEVSVGEVLTAIKEKEKGEKVSIDLSKAQPDDLRVYFAEILPNFDRERVYPSDIKKVLKWYEMLMSNNITDFSKKEEKVEETADSEKDEATGADDKKNVKKAPKTKAAQTTIRKEGAKSMTAAKATKARPTPKTSTPKKSVVGAKRGG
jgi:uncharacterized protein YdaT